jgi:bifunctional NMN adenylyltransferase/nudix hydrolase
MAKTGTGIIIGRFQVVELNKVHKKLFSKVIRRHQKVAVFLTSNPAPSDLNPIDLLFRFDLVEEKYGDKINVLEMPDLPDDRIWSQELDRRILEMKPEGSVTIYGTREGFTERYSGRYSTEILEAPEEDMPELLDIHAGWDIRSFRAGMIFAAMRRFPTVYPTVDIAVMNDDMTEVLLARKENETKFRFPGGFSDPSDDNFEMAAIRELMEECGDVEVDNLVYLGSSQVDDWRYRNAADGIITHLYACTYVRGEPQADDDIAEVKWFTVKKLKEDSFVHEHRALWLMLKNFIEEMGENRLID